MKKLTIICCVLFVSFATVQAQNKVYATKAYKDSIAKVQLGIKMYKDSVIAAKNSEDNLLPKLTLEQEAEIKKLTAAKEAYRDSVIAAEEKDKFVKRNKEQKRIDDSIALAMKPYIDSVSKWKDSINMAMAKKQNNVSSPNAENKNTVVRTPEIEARERKDLEARNQRMKEQQAKEKMEKYLHPNEQDIIERNAALKKLRNKLNGKTYRVQLFKEQPIEGGRVMQLEFQPNNKLMVKFENNRVITTDRIENHIYKIGVFNFGEEEPPHINDPVILSSIEPITFIEENTDGTISLLDYSLHELFRLQLLK